MDKEKEDKKKSGIDWKAWVLQVITDFLIGLILAIIAKHL